MPRQILPHLDALHNQMRGILNAYRRMLDDEFLFAAAVQVPQVAVIFERAGDAPLHFRGEALSLAELLTLIAYRYGFQQVQRIGQGGYAVVLGNPNPAASQPRRVLRLVPEHHVRSVVADSAVTREYDVRLDEQQEPIRDPDFPLLLSDLFLLPRHTTRLVFQRSDGTIAQAAGHPAILHCQLLPEVKAFNEEGLNRQMAQQAGELLETALATLGVSVADAHGGNGGVLLGADGEPLVQRSSDAGDAAQRYTPLVLDYGYYSAIGPRQLAALLWRHGVWEGQSQTALAETIKQSPDTPGTFGRWLYRVGVVNPNIWITPAQDRWQTIKEQTYPALRDQSRLSRLYPDYDEVLFPQRIETYTFQV